jgi:hypothetical protein
MDWFWTWGGECFGYRSGDNLFAHHGRQVGRFHGNEVYGSDGRYLGEIKSRNRLITNTSKIGQARYAFGPIQGGSYARYADYVGYAMYSGYEDFPSPDSFK